MQAVRTVSRALACCCALAALAACDSDAVPDPPAATSSQAGPETSQEVVSDDAINDLADSASEAAQELMDALVLRPTGVGQLRLGMSSEQVRKTGVARAVQGSHHDGWARGCKIVFYDAEQFGGVPGGRLNGVVSPEQGLETLYATRRMVTPAGIRIGSSVDEVRSAYDRPNLEAGDLVTVPTGHGAVYSIQLRRTVTSISLDLRHLDCGR